MKRRHGFTLIEMLVAIALMAMMITALLSFVFSMTEIWGHGGEKRLFTQHVNAVTRHLESMMRRAALPTAGVSTDEAFSFEEVRSPTAGTVNGLTFTLTAGDRLMLWGNTPAPYAETTLAIDREQGLVLFWRSQLEEDEEAWRLKPVTPLVTSLTYAYYEEEAQRWRKEATPLRSREGLWRVPEQIILNFKHRDLEAERTITLPLAPGGMPIL